jgi:hypothetical protein
MLTCPSTRMQPSFSELRARRSLIMVVVARVKLSITVLGSFDFSPVQTS